VILQFMGFGQIVQDGYYLQEVRVRLQLPLLFVTVVHLIHLGGVISLLDYNL
jgi:hypothetical protein